MISEAWLAYLNMGVLLGTLALALFNASEDTVARNFGIFYAAVSVGVLVRPIPLTLRTPSAKMRIGLRLGSVPETDYYDPKARSRPLW